VTTTPAMTIRPRLERDEGIKWLLAKRGGLHQQWVTCVKAISQQQSATLGVRLNP